MSLESAIRSDGNSKISYYVQRRNKDGQWEAICTVYSPCNFGKQGAIDTMRKTYMDSELGKYNRAKKKGPDQVRIMTARELSEENKQEPTSAPPTVRPSPRELLTIPIDHEAARKVCNRYINEDFDKIIQHDKSDVNLMRAYLDLSEEMARLAIQELDRVLTENPLIKAMKNTCPIPIMGKPKEVPVKVDFSCTHGSEDEATPSFRFIDANSGTLIMDVRLDYKSFGQLMTGLGHRPAKARVFDTFKVIGMYCEHKTIYITRPKNYNRDERDKELTDIIERECGEFLSTGWGIYSNGSSTQQNDANKWKVILYRYVKEKTVKKETEE